MPQDELEHLRTILAHAYDPPRKRGMRTILQRVAKGFFVTPKKVIMERVQVESVQKTLPKKMPPSKRKAAILGQKIQTSVVGPLSEKL